MGFYTVASCYRSGPHPPIVTGADLADFCQCVMDMDIIQTDALWGCDLKYGQSIDQDDRSTYCEEQISAHSFLMLDYDWDVSESWITSAETMRLLQQPCPSNIYRARINLGVATQHAPISSVPNDRYTSVDFPFNS